MNLDWHILGAAMGSWILTYLLHATVLLSGAALAAIALRARPELEEAIWKLALVGGLLTASLQPAVAGWKSAQPTVGEQLAVAGATPQLPDSRVAGYSDAAVRTDRRGSHGKRHLAPVAARRMDGRDTPAVGAVADRLSQPAPSSCRPPGDLGAAGSPRRSAAGGDRSAPVSEVDTHGGHSGADRPRG